MGRVTLALAALTVEKAKPQRMRTIVCDRNKIRDPYVYAVNGKNNAITWGAKREGAWPFDTVEQAREQLARSPGVNIDKLTYTPITIPAELAKASADWHDTMRNFRLG